GQNDAVEYGMINPGTMQWWSPAGAIDVEFGPIVEDWTHVAVVLNAEGFKVFANGEIIGENAGGGPVSSGDTLNIGGDGVFDAEGNFFLGEIDDVAIWDEALSDSQIADLANQVICPLGACGGSGFNITEVNREADGAVSLTWVSGAGNFYDIEASPNMS
ncbi:MAG: LamG-like jellyroll fold domain-containing protein, partial [Verrucomicrobiales bacterium]